MLFFDNIIPSPVSEYHPLSLVFQICWWLSLKLC